MRPPATDQLALADLLLPWPIARRRLLRRSPISLTLREGAEVFEAEVRLFAAGDVIVVKRRGRLAGKGFLPVGVLLSLAFLSPWRVTRLDDGVAYSYVRVDPDHLLCVAREQTALVHSLKDVLADEPEAAPAGVQPVWSR